MTLTNYIAYLNPSLSTPRVGHLDIPSQLITPLSFVSGTPITSVSSIITASLQPVPTRFAELIPLSSVQLLPPLPDRDVLAVGKNYSEHAKEFNSSGYDSSDRTDVPTHPVIFTKRATSIIASGEPIWEGKGWTETLDYEGEVGVIVGKPCRNLTEAEAWDYVW
jgi:2-keto-4-pentenoate hydratase/2-oxohepta-3-ene-1,7-dioic acid hydratase in catechol pathway